MLPTYLTCGPVQYVCQTLDSAKNFVTIYFVSFTLIPAQPMNGSLILGIIFAPTFKCEEKHFFNFHPLGEREIKSLIIRYVLTYLQYSALCIECCVWAVFRITEIWCKHKTEWFTVLILLTHESYFAVRCWNTLSGLIFAWQIIRGDLNSRD